MYGFSTFSKPRPQVRTETLSEAKGERRYEPLRELAELRPGHFKTL